MPQKILLITADQWRGDALQCLGHPAAQTPNLDALAAEGMLFGNHYTPSTPCGPARATLLTGLYPHIHRSVRNGIPLDARHSNIALEVRAAGFDPVLVGYTDSSADPRALDPDDPRLRTYEGVLPGFRVEAAVNGACLDEWMAVLRERGYDIPTPPSDIYRHEGEPDDKESFSRAPARYRAEDSDTAFIADRVLDYLQSRESESWFMHAVFLRPHPPLIAPAPYNELVSADDLPSPRRLQTRQSEAAQHPFLDAWLAEQDSATYYDGQFNVQAATEDDGAAMRAVYFGLIAEVDQQIGRILDHLKTTGQYDDTLIIFTSDHGEMLGDHWSWGKGGWYDASNHIPLIIRDPRTPAPTRGQKIEAFTESVDLMPTMLDWLDLPAPRNCSGIALTPWLTGQPPARWRRAAFWEFDFRNTVTRFYEDRLGLSPDECTLNVIRDERYKYVHFTSLPPLLYDLREDPHELNDLAAHPEYLPIMSEYARKLASHRMLHTERALTNAALTADGVVTSASPRGMPDSLYYDLDANAVSHPGIGRH